MKNRLRRRKKPEPRAATLQEWVALRPGKLVTRVELLGVLGLVMQALEDRIYAPSTEDPFPEADQGSPILPNDVPIGPDHPPSDPEE